MKSDFVEQAIFEKIFPYMTPENVRAVSLSLQTGLRIGDVVSLKRHQLNKKTRILRFIAQKTGKNGTCELSLAMVDMLCKNSGKVYLFEGKDVNHHRTRQAVWTDVKKACKRAGVDGVNVTPHSARKNYAVNLYRRSGSISEVQASLQHNNAELSRYYATSDIKKAPFELSNEAVEFIQEIVRNSLRLCLADFFCKNCPLHQQEMNNV